MTVLKGIPHVLPPRLLHVLASMGHGDELVGGHYLYVYVYMCVNMYTNDRESVSRPAIHPIIAHRSKSI